MATKQKRTGKTPKVRFPNIPSLSSEDKIKLATAVQQHPEIWKLDHPRYKQRDTHGKSWIAISQLMELTVTECKRVWKSMRDALRYRKSAYPKGKSGDSGPDESDADETGGIDTYDDQITSWIFWDCMKFVALQKTARKTISSLEGEAEETTEHPANSPTVDTLPDNASAAVTGQTEEATGISSGLCTDTSRSNYDYANHVKSKRKRQESSYDGTDRIAAGIEDLIKIRKESLTTSVQSQLEYHSMFVNLDRMLKKLPPSIVEDLNMKFMNLTYEAIKSNNEQV